MLNLRVSKKIMYTDVHLCTSPCGIQWNINVSYNWPEGGCLREVPLLQYYKFVQFDWYTALQQFVGRQNACMEGAYTRLLHNR